LENIINNKESLIKKEFCDKTMAFNDQYVEGLEKILKRKRLFLLDTNIFFSQPSGCSHLEDDVMRFAADLEFMNRKFDRIDAAYELIRKHDNVRITVEVYNELLTKFGNMCAAIYKKKTRSEIAKKVDDYLRRNKMDLVISWEPWKKSLMWQAGDMLRLETAKRNPDIHKLADADISLLLKGLEFVTAEGDKYQKADIIACDYGIMKGAEAMFDILDKLPLDVKDKMIRTARHRCMKVFSRKYEEPYHEVFDSALYCHRQ